jgi:hypothetical protein
MFALFLVWKFVVALALGRLLFQEILPHFYQQTYETNFNIKKDTTCLSATSARTFLPDHTSSQCRRLIFVAATEENLENKKTMSQMQIDKLKHVTGTSSQPNFKTVTPTNKCQFFPMSAYQ